MQDFTNFEEIYGFIFKENENFYFGEYEDGNVNDFYTLKIEIFKIEDDFYKNMEENHIVIAKVLKSDEKMFIERISSYGLEMTENVQSIGDLLLENNFPSEKMNEIFRELFNVAMKDSNMLN